MSMRILAAYEQVRLALRLNKILPILALQLPLGSDHHSRSDQQHPRRFFYEPWVRPIQNP
jgi:hypothetical protein